MMKADRFITSAKFTPPSSRVFKVFEVLCRVQYKPGNLVYSNIFPIEAKQGNWDILINFFGEFKKQFVAAILLVSFSTASVASGFAILEHSVTELGNAYAGSASAAQDSSTIYFNPAGLSKLSGTEFIFGSHLILPNAQFASTSSTDITGRPLTGNNSGNAGEIALIPNVYFSTDITEKLRIGLGVNAPFGLATDYNKNWQGRYDTITSDLLTVNLNPSFSYAINDWFSIGAGVNFQYIDFRFSNAIDFGTLCFGALDSQSCGTLGLLPQAADGRAKLKGDDWSVGYNIGLMFEPIQGTRLGLAYRSKISHTLRGTAEFNVPQVASPLLASGAFKNTRVHGRVDMPETISFGAFHQLNDNWAIMANVTWTRWNRFKVIRFEFDNPAQAQTSIEQKWENSFHYALGASYKANQNWTFRLGTAYDETPIPNENLRTAQIPGTSRYWLSSGLSYHGYKPFTIDIAYAHLFVPDSKIDRTDNFGHRINGSYENSVDILSAQIRWAF